MKRNFFHTMAVAAILLGASLTASAAERLKVNVPFSFVVGGLSFQPGQYTVAERGNGILLVQGVGQAAAVLTVPGEYSKTGTPASLRFASDGHEYHLVGVQVEGEISRDVPAPSTLERKLSMGTR